MKLPFVSRERYDELTERHTALVERYNALLLERAKPAAKAAKPPRDAMVDKIAADLGATIADPVLARAEAERIKREAFGV